MGFPNVVEIRAHSQERPVSCECVAECRSSRLKRAIARMKEKGLTRAFTTWLSQSSISFAVVDVGHDLRDTRVQSSSNHSMHGPLPRSNQSCPNIVIASPLPSQSLTISRNGRH